METFPQQQLDLFWSYSQKEWLEQLNHTELLETSGQAFLPDNLKKVLSDREQYHIYLSISNFLFQHYHTYTAQRQSIASMLGKKNKDTPYIIGLAGGVAAGKTTTAAIFRAFLSQMIQSSHVEIVSTDNFLYPNAILKKKGMMERKGFPESYDMKALIHFLQSVKTGQADLKVPIYSHDTYDVSRDEEQTVQQPNIILLEGINVLQRPQVPVIGKDVPAFISDYLDNAIYVNADETSAIEWYLQRVENLYTIYRHDPSSYFHQFSDLKRDEFRQLARQVWEKVNGPNLKKYISPTYQFANIILNKGSDHKIEQINLRKF